MPTVPGKQIRAGSIPSSALNTAFLGSLETASGSVPWTGDHSANSFKLTGLAQPTNPNDAARLQDLQLQSWKTLARVATVGNVSLTGTQTIDTIAVAVGERVLVRAQTNAAQNGIYLVATGAWSRTSDADSAAELRGAIVPIESGATYADHRFAMTTDAPITVDTTALTFVDIGAASPSAYDRVQQSLTCNVCTTNYSLLTSTAIAATPTSGGVVRVAINGVEQFVGDGVRTTEVYFSRDSGAGAVALNAVQSGDQVYFNAVIAGWSTDASDVVSLWYGV